MFCKKCGFEIPLNGKFCKNCGQETPIIQNQNKLFLWLKLHKIGVIIGIIVLFLIIVILSYSEETPSQPTNTTPTTIEQKNDNSTQEEIASSVVNIFCPSTVTSEDVSGGSGTIISEDGMILTNSHIVPQDKTYIHVDETGCLVVLPDPTTGQPTDVYLAHPIVLPDLSEKYDLAFMEIYAAYYDEEKKEYEGIYPKKFPSFDDTTRCKNENVQLGEPVRIFGYPAISGGYSLTLTDGIVSSFPGDGLIVTSAKISHGNSGGLAVDKNGCMIGVPSMVSYDEAESLGVIISMDLVNKFSEEVDTYLNNIK